MKTPTTKVHPFNVLVLCTGNSARSIMAEALPLPSGDAPMNAQRRLEVSLLGLRLGVFLVLAIWTVDKWINPQHAIGIFEGFYGIGGIATQVMYAIAAVQALIVLGFVLGVAKTWTYGAVLLMHAVSTLSSYRQYLDPFTGPHLLFFAAWPMLAACFALYLLRDSDRMWTLGRPRR